MIPRREQGTGNREQGDAQPPGRVAASSHRELIVWQKGMDLVVHIYRVTATFPRTETYGLISQVRRAATSVPANIAEGNARGTRKDYAHFLSIAKGSLMELETYVLLAHRLDYLPQPERDSLLAVIGEISRMLTSLRSKLL